ncbi:kinase-like protein, partial [Meredithblackwellia eburnea MCA 4105]
LPVKDKDGHFIVRIGDVIDRYAIRRNLGQGTFGKVVCAAHVITGKQVAVKVIRNVPKYREASKVEVKVLNLLKENDAKNQYKCIHLIETFEWVGHVCLVTELLSSSVFDFLKDNGYQPFPLRQIQEFARQLLLSVKYIHSLDLIHTDLKPENILLESTDFREEPVPVSQSNKKSKTTKRILENTNIRLIDFGSATFSGEYHATIVSTRHYRAPEIILGTGWSFECDIWSIGCILIEFFTGEALFQTHENVEHLAMMQRVFGEMPKALMQKGEAHPDWFLTELKSGKTRPYKLNFPVIKAQNVQNAQPVTSKQSIKFVKQMQPLKVRLAPESIAQNRFLDLLERLLQWEPERRISIKDALNHPFFQVRSSSPSHQNYQTFANYHTTDDYRR